MARRYGGTDYSLVIDSSFSPFTLQEMMTPMLMYKDVFEKEEAAYDELNRKAGDFEYLAKTLPEGSQARTIYEGYANDLKAQADDFSQNGLSMNNRRALMGLKRRYASEIGRLEKASAAMDEEKKYRRQMAQKDTSLLYANDNLTIDSFLDGNTPNLYSVSGDDLYKRGAQAATSASSRIYNNTEVSNLTKYYQELTQTQGYNPQLLAEFRSRMEAIPELQQAVDAILQEKGVNDNLTGANYQRARQSVINGILDGAVYKEARSIKDNPGVLTAAQAASNALGWANHNESVRQHNMQIEMQGYEKDANGNWSYNPDKDVVQKKAEAIGYDPNEWEKGPDGKWHKKAKGSNVASKGSKVDLLENESYDTKTGYSGPAPSGQNATYGTEITMAEAMELAPDLVSATGEMRNYYRYYKNGTRITRRRIHTSVTPDAEGATQPTGAGTTTGNGSNHNAL